MTAAAGQLLADPGEVPVPSAPEVDGGVVAGLLAELEAHDCAGYCTSYASGSGTGTRKCPDATSLRILLFRAASTYGLHVIPERLLLWVVGPNQRRFVNKRWTYADGPNGTYWRERDRASGEVNG